MEVFDGSDARPLLRDRHSQRIGRRLSAAARGPACQDRDSAVRHDDRRVASAARVAVQAACTHVGMESTSVYWRPVFNLLEGSFDVVSANAQHIKAVPGRKTDVKDCEWIANLLAHGLIRASFIPPPAIRDLHDLTRHRKSLRLQTIVGVGRRSAEVMVSEIGVDTSGAAGGARRRSEIGGRGRDPR